MLRAPASMHLAKAISGQFRSAQDLIRFCWTAGQRRVRTVRTTARKKQICGFGDARFHEKRIPHLRRSRKTRPFFGRSTRDATRPLGAQRSCTGQAPESSSSSGGVGRCRFRSSSPPRKVSSCLQPRFPASIHRVPSPGDHRIGLCLPGPN